MKKLCLLLVLCLLLSGCGTKQSPPVVTDPTLGVTTTPSTTPATEPSTTPTTAPTTGDCDDGHIDNGNDGFCDRCSAFLLIIVDFYGINDLHGKLADADAHPGLDELSTYLEDAKESNDYSVFLSAGDMWQGSSESNLTQGLILTDWMNEMGFAAMAMGNHEYDWGESPIEKNDGQAKFPFLAINIYDRETDERVSYCDSSTMVDLGPLQIGIIGAVGDCYSSISADKVEDVYFKTGSDLTSLVKAESNKLREQGADYIVYLLHDGYTSSKSGSISSNQLKGYYDISLSQGYVDLVFEGHTHQKYVVTDLYGVYHLQGGGDNEGISHVEVAINSANGKSKVQEAKLVPTKEYAGYDDHPIVEDLLGKYSQQVSIGTQVLGTNQTNRGSNYMEQLAADLYYQAGMERWGDRYDIVLGGGFISVRDPRYLAAGDVTYGMLYSLFPFDNQLVLCSIKGKDLASRFFGGNDRYYISYGDYGRQVKNNINPNGTYYVVVDTYSLLYGPNKLTEVARYDDNVYARDLLANYAKAGGFAK
ncbi:MAG: bifunctional metallophosphatase/5'-nucleotidase [Oscillospiraceae bacterium]|nr:bifunctional metallophosphatase/5'-nucleotidase [Oscillospiraceae bacterium]